MNAKRIVVHHSGTDDGPEFNTASIRRTHIEVNGWLDIGYHALIELVNGHYEIIYGRPWWMNGAHTIGQNAIALGICFIGDFNVDFISEEQLEAGAKLIRTWMDIYTIGVDDIFPHCHFNSTDCPGANFDMTELKAAAEGIHA